MIKYRELIPSQVLTAVATVYYTAPASTQAAIHQATASNPTGAAVVVNLYKVPSAGTPAVANRIGSRIVPAGGTVTLFDAINHKIEPGTSLAADGLGCGISVSGVEFVPD